MSYNSVIEVAILVLSSLAATLFDSAIEDSIQEKMGIKSNNFIMLLIHFAVSLLAYVALSVGVVAIYACCRSQDGISNFSTVFENLIGYYIKSHIIEFLVVPTLAYVFTRIIELSKYVKLLIAIFVCALLFISPKLIYFEAPNKLPMESEILTELRSINVPYEGQLMNITHF